MAGVNGMGQLDSHVPAALTFGRRLGVRDRLGP